MGDRWGLDGPPEDAYGRVTDPDRFRGLHAAGRALLDELESSFRVRRTSFLDTEWLADGEPAEMLDPSDDGAASLGLTFAEPYGVHLWTAGRRGGYLPQCACDACDTTLDEAVAGLRQWAQWVTRGSFGEQLVIEGGQWWHRRWWEVDGARGSGSSPVDDAEAERLLALMPSGARTWSSWPSTVGQAS